MTTTRGVVHIHSAPSALCPHVEWALGGVLGAPVQLDWRPQPALPGTYRTEHTWRGDVGSATRLASTLKRWSHLRFEITEQATLASEAERYSFTPRLGIFHALVAQHGDIVVPEEQLKVALAEHAGDAPALAAALHALLGTAWDEELEIFRQAADTDALRWLHRVG